MLSWVLVDAFTAASRPVALSRLKRAIAEAGGVIVDFAFDSNASLRLTVELEGGAVRRLREALSDAAVVLFDRCAASLDAAERLFASTKPVKAMLYVSTEVPPT